jgi:cellulose synthase/poly-beta-1,6-N-acetylglucosamine synthase-like glycosyltransferase
MIELGLYLLGIVNVVVGLYSLASAWNYRSYIRRITERETLQTTDLPSVALLVPCCGLEPGLEENLRAIALQDYPDFELFLIVEDESDPAVPVIQSLRQSEKPPSRLIIAGPTQASSQKIHNLLAGLSHTGDQEVLAFADSDIRPSVSWLRRLVAPLEDESVGVATGYRFYIPEKGSFASLLRSIWNAGVLTILGDHDHNFAWGGSMAIRQQVFHAAEVAKSWHGALSDDYALTHAVRNAGYRVEFVPSSIVPTFGAVNLKQVFRWCFRQMSITKVYWRNLWRIGGGSQIVYVTFLIAGMVAASTGDEAALFLLSSVLILSVLSGYIRVRAIQALGPEWKRRLRGYTWSYALLAPFASVLTAYGFVRSALSQRIEWRGRTYEMRSPNDTVLIHWKKP